jgi:hypothetical protein
MIMPLASGRVTSQTFARRHAPEALAGNRRQHLRKNTMNSHEIVDPPHPATAMELVDSGVNPTAPGMVDAAVCECGLPEPCCNDDCRIDDCDWMVY